MAFTNVFDVTQPLDTQAANQLGLDIRTAKLDLQQRVAAMSGADSAKPAFGSDTQPANWAGALYFATDTKITYQWSGSAWASVAPGVLINNTPVTGTVTGTLQTLTTPANFFVVGGVYNVVALMSANSAITDFMRFELLVGGYVAVSTPMIGSQSPGMFRGVLSLRPGNIMDMFIESFVGSGATNSAFCAGGPVGFDPTATHTFATAIGGSPVTSTTSYLLAISGF
jgi:hypothetical protein